MHLCQKLSNGRRDKKQGIKLRAEDVSTADLQEGFRSEKFRYMY